MSPMELEVLVFQWRDLTRFAAFGAERFWMNASFIKRGEYEGGAGRYLRYFHGLTDQRWAEVEAFSHANPGLAEGQITFADEVPEYAASSVAMQWRLLFGFAAQYTMYAADEAEAYLRDKHELSDADWEISHDFLRGQEGA